MEVFDCFLGFFRIAHLDEAKTAGFARGPIEDDINRHNLPHGSEMILDVILRGVMIDVSDE